MTVYTSHVVLFGKGHFLYILQLIRSNHLCADPDDVAAYRINLTTGILAILCHPMAVQYLSGGSFAHVKSSKTVNMGPHGSNIARINLID